MCFLFISFSVLCNESLSKSFLYFLKFIFFIDGDTGKIFKGCLKDLKEFEDRTPTRTSLEKINYI